MKKLVFIEGVSGVGKSTLTQKLRNKLREMGFSVDYYLEFDSTNPIDFYCVAYFKQDEYFDLLKKHTESAVAIRDNTIFADDIRLIRYYKGDIAQFPAPLLGLLREREFCWNPIKLVPMTEYTRVYRILWERFAQNTDSHPDYLLFDGSLFHHPINDLMRNYNATPNQAAEHVHTLLDAVSSLHPHIIYLSTDNIAERLYKAHISRGETPCSKEKIKFWEARKQSDLTVMNQLSTPHKFYDISQENWDALLPEILEQILREGEQ